MARVEIHCGERGHDFGVAFDVDPAVTTGEEVRARLREELHAEEAVICPRCKSVLLLSAVSASSDESERMRRARFTAAMAPKVLGVRVAVGSPDGPHSTVWRFWQQKGKSDHLHRPSIDGGRHQGEPARALLAARLHGQLHGAGCPNPSTWDTAQA
jgi:hypothetical protein